MAQKAALIILDGWGIGNQDKTDGIHLANTPFVDSLYHGPHAQLRTDGLFVGLPEGQMGNSEVGHLNIGAGRVVYQELARINKAIDEDTIQANPALNDAIAHAKSKNRPLHLVGLVSDGGVHSHINHLVALANHAIDSECEVYIHAILDGRDTHPTGGDHYLQILQGVFENKPVSVVSVIGRYYAMDRDHRWERVEKAYELLCASKGEPCEDLAQAIGEKYKAGITDEFMEPLVSNQHLGKGSIQDGDAVFCFNFRTDRCREITQALTQEAIPGTAMKPLDLHYTTMTRYDEKFKGIHVAFEKENLDDTLGETVSKAGKTQVRIAETEKYPHVTFFFSGGRELEFPGEKRLMAASPKVPTYDLQPEMSAEEVASSIISEIEQNEPDFICLNFANPDMVGHTGVPEAIIKAVETTDQQCERVVQCLRSKGYAAVIIADHGNADKMMNADGSPNTAHTTHPVPVFIDNCVKPIHTLEYGKLADVAPTILKIMEIPQPEAMTGKPLF